MRRLKNVRDKRAAKRVFGPTKVEGTANKKIIIS
jgi:hypothetical protein